MKRLAKSYKQQLDELNLPDLRYKISILQDDVNEFYKKTQEVCDYINNTEYDTEILEQTKKVKEFSLSYKREINEILDKAINEIKNNERELEIDLNTLSFLVED